MGCVVIVLCAITVTVVYLILYIEHTRRRRRRRIRRWQKMWQKKRNQIPIYHVVRRATGSTTRTQMAIQLLLMI